MKNFKPIRPEIKTLWVESLESRKYPQTRGRLRDDYGFCVLGVLCDVHSSLTGIKWKWSPERGNHYMNKVSYLPQPLLAFCQMDEKTMKQIADESDAGLSFFHLAALIQKNL